jgi:hypothetical protein
VFVYAGLVKLGDPRGFAAVISRYGLAPEVLVDPLALGLPVLEVLAGLGLVLEVRGALGLITGMLAVFAGVLWFGVLAGLEIDCGCFSPAEQAQQHSLRQALWRDLGLLAVAGWLYFWRWRHGFPSGGTGGWRLMLRAKVEADRR